MTIIIGIDPGSRKTGYGLIRHQNNQSFYIASGCIALKSSDIGEKLQQIYFSLQEIIKRFQPNEAAVEEIFMHQNPNSALKLGQARGAAIVALGLPVAEYTARQVKQSVVGYGAADKNQIQQMVKRLLNVSMTLQADEADALAIALCHAHIRFCTLKYGQISQKKNSWRNFTISKK